MAFIAVDHPDGSHGIGSCFHVGEGVFVTARHVVDGVRIREIGTTVDTFVDVDAGASDATTTLRNPDGSERPVHCVESRPFELDSGPHFHPSDTVDVATFRVKEFDSHMPWVPLGSHLDDWLGENDFVLAEAIVLGYPPIPLTLTPHLIAARAEINAQVDLRGENHVHFILSA